MLAEPIRPGRRTACSTSRRRRASGSSSTRRRRAGTRHDRPSPARPPRTGWRARPPSSPGPSCSSTAGSSRRPRARRSTTSPARDGRRDRRASPSGGLEDVDRAVAAARRSFDDRRWSDQPPAARKKVLLRLAELVRARPRGARPARVARRRQADPRHARRRRAELRDDAPVVRRDDRQDVRRDRADRPRRAVAGHPRADRRRRRDRAVELPADHHGLEARRGPRDRELGRPQAGQPVAAERPAPRRAGRRGRPARTASSTWSPGPGALLGDALARHPGVDKIAFTGSTEVGRSLLRAIGEIGRQGASRSSSAARARRSSSRTSATSRRPRSTIGWGIFYNSGQTCNAGLAAHRPPLRPGGAGRADRGVRARRSPRASRWTRARSSGRWSTSASWTRCSGYVELGRRGGRPRRRRRRAGTRRQRRLLHPADDPRRRRQHACGSRARRSSGRS